MASRDPRCFSISNLTVKHQKGHYLASYSHLGDVMMMIVTLYNVLRKLASILLRCMGNIAALFLQFLIYRC